MKVEQELLLELKREREAGNLIHRKVLELENRIH